MGDMLDLGFPSLSLGSNNMGNGGINGTPPGETRTVIPQNDSIFTHMPHAKDPTTDKVVQHTIQRLSVELINRPDPSDSLSSALAISAFGDGNTPPTPNTPPYFDLQTPRSASNSGPSILKHEQQYGPRLQLRTTTNRKLAMVRRQQYRGSNLRREVRFDDMSPQLPHTVDTSNFYSHGRSPPPNPWPSSDSPRCAMGPYCEDMECNHVRPEEAQKPYYPSLATQACIRMPHPASPQQREAEWDHRFPSSETLIHEGVPCVSPVCSAPGSAYTSPITTPFGTPPDTPSETPPTSKPASLRRVRRRGGISDGTEIGTESGESIHSIDSLDAHLGGIRRQSEVESRTSAPVWRRKSADKPLIEANVERETSNKALLPAQLSSKPQKLTYDRPVTLRGKLRNTFWREKVKTAKTRGSSNVKLS